MSLWIGSIKVQELEVTKAENEMESTTSHKTCISDSKCNI